MGKMPTPISLLLRQIWDGDVCCLAGVADLQGASRREGESAPVMEVLECTGSSFGEMPLTSAWDRVLGWFRYDRPQPEIGPVSL